MRLETTSDLNEQTLEKLQQLVRANIDSVEFLQEGAEKVEDITVAQLFRDMASQRNGFADELQQYVQWNGKDAEEEGTFIGSVRRTWFAFRTALNGGDATVVLIEAERAEDAIKEAYEDVLIETAGSALNDVLSRQYAVIKSGHDRVRDLRDAYKQRP
ncbi:MAG: histidine kinase [Pirellulaceae bacterium]|nr:MAG: histidine kinase [Pirellulaceae bacterium]